jgi:hypothetical protein
VNPDLSPELRAAVSSARDALTRFRADDNEAAKLAGVVNFRSAAYEMAANLNRILTLLGVQL